MRDITAIRNQATEKDFQAAVRRYADLRKWWVFAVRDSRGCPPGWPDLFCVRAPRVVAAELKSATGRETVEQRLVLSLLDQSGVEVHLWRPSDWEEIEEVLA